MTPGWTKAAHTLPGFLKQVIPSFDHRHFMKPLAETGGMTLRRKSRRNGVEDGIEIEFRKGDYCEIQVRQGERFAQLTGIYGDDGMIRLKSVDLGRFINHREQITHRFIWQGDADTAPKTARFQQVAPEIAPLDAARLEATCIALDHVAGTMFEMQTPRMDKLNAVFDPAPVTHMPALGPYRLTAQRLQETRLAKTNGSEKRDRKRKNAPRP